MAAAAKPSEKYSILIPTYKEHDNIKPLITLIMQEAKTQYLFRCLFVCIQQRNTTQKK